MTFVNLICQLVGNLHSIKMFDTIRKRLINYDRQKQCRMIWCSDVIEGWIPTFGTLMLQSREFKFLRIPVDGSQVINYPVQTGDSEYVPPPIMPTYKIIERIEP